MQTATVSEILAARIEPLMLSKKYRDFFGNLPKNEQFVIAITGEPGSAKSSFCFMLCREFLRCRQSVLYVAAEEKLSGGAIKERIKLVKMPKDHIEFFHPDTYQNIEDKLSAQHYDICIIDSINEIYDADQRAIEPKKVILITKKHPKTSFVFISQINAQGNRAAGGMKSTHQADVKIFCRRDKLTNERIAELRGNRFYPKEYEFQIFPPQAEKKR